MKTPHHEEKEGKCSKARKPNGLILSKDANKGEEAQARVCENNLCVQYEERVRPCIDLIDSLRALGVEQDLALPAIAVIGDQSSGKSSVLEALSGVALPRGSGIVTRCPLVLKLKKLRQEEKWRGKVSYMGVEEDIPDDSKVEGAIIKAQDLITGNRLGIKDELISLEIGSPSVPDLTLIDLPGITRVPVGNQPADIGRQIKQLIMKYIEKEETINLVVVPSNVDIATTEALSMAQEVDPKGDRTIGILTKPDLVDRGTEDKVVDIVHNLVCPLKKGYMIVKCRGQKDIEERLSLAESLQQEHTFFEDHPHFRVLLEDRRATVPCLAEKLSVELITHICKSLPLLENKIKENHQKTTEELQKCGKDIPDDGNERSLFLIEKINAFNRDINAVVQGEENVGMEGTRLFASLRNKFQKWNSTIANLLKEGYDNLQNDILKFENQHRGRELPGFVNYRTFETIMKKQLQVLEEPAVELLHESTDMVRNAFTMVAEKHFSEFLHLLRTSKNKIEDIRLGQEEAAEAAIRLHFQMEQVIYCQDQAYRGTLQQTRESTAPIQARPAFSSTLSNNFSTSEILQHLIAYHQEVRRSLSRHIPLVIQYYILQMFGLQLQNTMLQLLQDKNDCSWLLKESINITKKRKSLKERLTRLGQARCQLAKFPV
ncbi:interferon-induced GTP-binding protein Mx2 isoform X1 [Octodon degus]|uniref:Interferon-induced GTP-binding protein Mx2 isoform X1 n=1 Tax=Octodon degus TaxID=10160 RepID=A0A6P3F8V4_OCTDE|nr:interferon-induced GTP-binding protein Mx2 isoform X1 [Octodon degus]